MTCHAAIVSRELGIPCVVGTGEATNTLRDGEMVTVDAGAGVVREGAHRRPPRRRAAAADGRRAGAGHGDRSCSSTSPSPRSWSASRRSTSTGVGLLRAELMVSRRSTASHPRALLERGAASEFVERMAAALTRSPAAFAPRPITYRTIDFRTNEFRGLEGGERFEPWRPTR